MTDAARRGGVARAARRASRKAMQTADASADSLMRLAMRDVARTTKAVDPNAPGPFPGARGAGRLFNWLFVDKQRMFWALQTFGWAGFCLMHYLTLYNASAGDRQLFALFSASSTLTGFVVTSFVLRPVFQYARTLKPWALLGASLVAAVTAAIAITLIKAYLYIVISETDILRARQTTFQSENIFILLAPDIQANLFLLLSWSGFYFGINYYLTLRAQTEQALQSARLADQAQLTMLRYQLNPHFLFNTLNAISTLVLDRDAETANAMLTRLSSFLRYSLSSDPLQSAPLSEELRALRLYLEIEKVRFGDRLTVLEEVSEDAMTAVVPSLLLQPAIENAIKYAIAPSEEGGTLIIRARCVESDRQGAMLELSVCDEGPGLPTDPETTIAKGAGVGLANMRERLKHLYGERQSFRVFNREDKGVCVAMQIPCTRAGTNAGGGR